MRADEPALTVPIAFANQVEAQVIGEHGVSQVLLWSAARIAGVPIGKLIEARGESLDGVRKKIEDSVRYANITMIEGNDASQFGVGIVAVRITEMVLRDERAVVPIGISTRTLASACRFRGGRTRRRHPEFRAGDVRSGRRSKRPPPT
jgi:malate/lactate dehydrogenase